MPNINVVSVSGLSILDCPFGFLTFIYELMSHISLEFKFQIILEIKCQIIFQWKVSDHSGRQVVLSE